MKQQQMIRTGMTNKEVHAMKKGKTQPGTMGNDSIHLSKKVAKAKSYSASEDQAYDTKHGIKAGSKRDLALDRKRGLMKKKDKQAKKTVKRSAKGFAVKHTGEFQGKSNALGQGGRAAQMKAQGVPSGVIGNIARSEHAAPGQVNYHRKKK